MNIDSKFKSHSLTGSWKENVPSPQVARFEDKTDREGPNIESVVRFRYIFSIVVLFFFGALRIPGLYFDSIDGDELFSIEAVSGSWHSLFVRSRGDIVHPPFYYILLKLWAETTFFAPQALRLLSFISSLLCLFLGLEILRTLPSQSNSVRVTYTPVLMISILILNPVFIFYSQQLRSYSLYTTIVIALILCAVKIARQAGSVYQGLFLPLAVIGVMTHYVASLYVGIVCLWLMTQHRFKPASIALLSSGIALLSWFAYVLPALIQRRGLETNLSWQGSPAFKDLLGVFASVLWSPDVTGGFKLSGLLSLSLVSVPIYWTILFRRARLSSNIKLLSALALIPPIITFVLATSSTSLPIFGVRHVLPSVFISVIVICWVIELMVNSRPKLGFMGISSITLLGVLAIIFGSGAPERLPLKSIAGRLMEQDLYRYPVITSWSYGFERVLKYYSDSDRLIDSVSPETIHLVPDEFIFVYRNLPEEENFLAQLLLYRGFVFSSISGLSSRATSKYSPIVVLARHASN